MHPENAEALKPLKVNEVKMTKTDRSNEKDLRYIGNAICGAGKGLAYLMEMLSLAEEKCLQVAPDDEGKLVLDEFEFDFPQANMLLATSMKILGIANVQTGQARRELLASKFKKEYQKLCKPENPFQGRKFFGPTFDTAAALVTNENRVQKTALEPAPYKKKAKKWNHRGYRNTSVLQAAMIQQALAAAQPQIWPQQL